MSLAIWIYLFTILIRDKEGVQNYSGQEEISKACQGESKTPLSFAMATLKSPPWKCVDCRRMVKGSVTFCLGCGQHWEGCADRPARSCAQGLQGAVCTGARPTRAILGKDGNHGFQKTLWRSWSQRKRRWKRQRTSQGTDKESGATQSQGLFGPTGDGTIATTSKPADF